MDREALKELVRTEPTKRDTLAAVEPDCLAAEAHAAALRAKVDELLTDLDEIEAAKQQLAAMDEPEGEPEHVAPAAKPEEDED